MDELTLFRNTRSENGEPSEQALAAGRDALLARVTASIGLSDTKVPGREAQTPRRPSSLRRSVAPRWAAAAIAVALITLVVWVVVPALGLGGNNASRPAAIVPAPTTTSAETTPQVTRETYEAAYAEFAQCMKDNGVGLGAELMEGVIHQYTYLSSKESVYLECYADFEQIDMAWQIANEYDNPTQIGLRDCLNAIGVVPEQTVAGVWQQVQEHHIDPVECTLGVTTPPEE